jgi:hypothetical protein
VLRSICLWVPPYYRDDRVVVALRVLRCVVPGNKFGMYR